VIKLVTITALCIAFTLFSWIAGAKMSGHGGPHPLFLASLVFSYVTTFFIISLIVAFFKNKRGQKENGKNQPVKLSSLFDMSPVISFTLALVFYLVSAGIFKLWFEVYNLMPSTAFIIATTLIGAASYVFVLVFIVGIVKLVLKKTASGNQELGKENDAN